MSAMLTAKNYRLIRCSDNLVKVIGCMNTKSLVRFRTGGKLSYFHKIGERPLLGKTVGNILDLSAEKYGKKDAVVVCETNTRKNFLELKEDVDKFAAGLIALGLKRGDRIGIWSPNNYEWIITHYAAAKAGLLLVNINPAYKTSELEYCVKKVGIRAMVCAESCKSQNYYQMMQAIIPNLESSKPGEIQTRSNTLSHIIMISQKKFGGTFTFSDVANIAQISHFEKLKNLQKEIDFDHPFNIQFTSGTTGKPKGATLSHFNVINNAFIIGKTVGYNDGIHRLCIPVPLYHCFGSVVGCLSALIFGACQIYPASLFNTSATAEALQNENCTSLYGTPTMFIDLLNIPNRNTFDFKNLKSGLMTGAPCPEALIMDCIDKINMKQLCICYGSTETSPVITVTSPTDSVRKRSTTVGSVMEHTELKLVDSVTGRIVPCGSVGELCTRGYLVMSGYWDDDEKTKECITISKWFKTGDLAVADEDGYVKIVGRLKDMIIRGGENIYPREIEEVLHTHNKVAEVQVVGVPDKRLGEELCVWISLKPGEILTEGELREFCKQKLAHFKIPRYIKFVQPGSFPLTVSGKIQKFQIRELAIQELNL